VSEFHGLYSQLLASKPSGTTLEDIRNRSIEAYSERTGKHPESFVGAWELLRECPKWCDLPTGVFTPDKVTVVAAAATAAKSRFAAKKSSSSATLTPSPSTTGLTMTSGDADDPTPSRDGSKDESHAHSTSSRPPGTKKVKAALQSAGVFQSGVDSIAAQIATRTVFMEKSAALERQERERDREMQQKERERDRQDRRHDRRQERKLRRRAHQIELIQLKQSARQKRMAQCSAMVKDCASFFTINGRLDENAYIIG